MPKMKLAGIKKGKGGIDILNAIRADASQEYKDRIPLATRQNIADIGNAMKNYSAGQNEFLSALVNRIGMVVIKNKLYNNPLKEFKRGMLEFGDTIEEIFVDIAKAKAYAIEPQRNDLGDVFEVTRPDVQSRFHKINRQDYYPVTINQSDLMKAFTSAQNLDDFISKIIESLYTGAEFDEFILTKNLIGDYKNKFFSVQVPAVTDEESAKEFAVIARQYANNLTFMSDKYNYANVKNFTPHEDQVIFLRSDYEARMSVDVLAYAFNMSKADFLSRAIILDDFGGDESDDTVAILVDKDWFMIYDNKYEMTEQYNARYLYWNYFLHIWQIYSTSEFANAIRFTTSTVTPSVESVTVSPATASVKKGETSTFTADVEVTNDASREVTWSVTGASSVDVGTTIVNGLLTVSAGEQNTTLTVTATSVADGSKTGTATVTVTE